MTPQFVDFNSDGFTDIITATFDGSPHVSYGTADGFAQPSHILDRKGLRMELGQFWDYDAEQWKNLNGAQCISAVAFDWDNDGDFDLLLGDYKTGVMYRRMNEGTNTKPQFSTDNVQIMMDGEPFTVDGGMGAPRLVDWDNDGLTDLVAGSFKGGVFLYRNTGKVGAPAFAKPTALIERAEIDSKGTVKFPTQGCYVEAVDYDADGDLDLLVGGYAQWEPELPGLTDEQKSRINELNVLAEELATKMQDATAGLQERAEQSGKTIDELYQKLFEDPEYKKLQATYTATWRELAQLQPGPKREAGVWLYRRK